jgi:X-Pro dipeptidyl-peptidase (S15 family)
VINADLRGWGTSEGELDVLCEQEDIDIYDLIEWAAEQPWSTRKVGMNGVSYRAVSQWNGGCHSTSTPGGDLPLGGSPTSTATSSGRVGSSKPVS